MAVRQLTDKNNSGELNSIYLGGTEPANKVLVQDDLSDIIANDAPSDGSQYARKDAAWDKVVTDYLMEAPIDGEQYARKNAAWSTVPVDQMVWKGEWVSGSYLQHQVVRDRDWTMIANKDTSERPAPQPIGDPFYYFDDVLVDIPVTAKQVFFGSRYTSVNAFYLTGYRVKTIVGNHYKLYLVEDPLGVAQHSLLASFTAIESGWKNFGIANVIVGADITFDMVAFVQEPNPTPTTWVGNWNYLTPNNSGVPSAGEVIHANNAIDQLWIDIIDDAAGNRYAELAVLTIGDIIEAASQRWAIQSITDNTTYFIFGISPASQGTPTGTQTFTFETVTATPITYGKLTDYWLANAQVSGLYIADGEYGNIVPDNHAYGMDIQVQQANLPVDWDVVAQSEGGSGSYDPNPLLTYDLVKESGYTTTSDVFSQVAQLITPNRVAGTYEFGMAWVWQIATQNHTAQFRYMIDNNGTWYLMSQEAKSEEDVHHRYYGFPLVLTGKPLQIDFQAASPNGSLLTVSFCDLMIRRVA